MGLPKSHRLKHRSDFNRVYQKGSRFRSTYLTLRVLQRNRSTASAKLLQAENSDGFDVQAMLSQDLSQLPTRIGISISSKVDKRSVVRNRIRRQLQAIFRQMLPLLPPSWDLLVVVHPEAVQCDYRQFLQELEELLIKAEVINGNSRGCVL